MSDRLPPLLPLQLHPQRFAPTDPARPMALTQHRPLEPHIFMSPIFPDHRFPRALNPRSGATGLTQPVFNAYANAAPPSHPPSYGHDVRQHGNHSFTPGSGPSRAPGAAPLASLLHHESPAPNHSGPVISPREQMQISSRTFLGPEASPSFHRQPPRALRHEPLTAFHGYSPKEAYGPMVASPVSSRFTNQPSPSQPYDSGTSPAVHSRSLTGTGPPATAFGRPVASSSSGHGRYQLTIRQQPKAARACGHGERDRRVVDPPPILQLTLRDFDPESPADVNLLRWPFNVVTCALWSVPQPSVKGDTGYDVTRLRDPSIPDKDTRRLMGTLVASPFLGTDPAIPGIGSEDSRMACFFTFPDLSCRQAGDYRLRFTLISISAQSMPCGARTAVSSVVISDKFTVYNAKDFPGMEPSTELMKDLKRQGASVAVKKGNEGRNTRKGMKRDNAETDGSASGNSDRETGARSEAKKRKA